VQLVGVDGYFIGSENSWDQVFARVFAEVRQFTARPFLITETSVQPGPNAAQWVSDLFAGIDSVPAVRGFIWFDFNKAAENRDDWRLEDDPAALAAFRAAVKEYG
jgi:mannan endo-1,4-beta-mannosidase